jgi:hypothetical protein
VSSSHILKGREQSSAFARTLLRSPGRLFPGKTESMSKTGLDLTAFYISLFGIQHRQAEFAPYLSLATKI